MIRPSLDKLYIGVKSTKRKLCDVNIGQIQINQTSNGNLIDNFVDWSNGNVIDTMVFGIILYTVFLLTSKMKLIPNIILYTLLFSVYLINTQRLYWENRELINQEQSDSMVNYIKIALSASVFVFFYGIIDYFIYEKNKHKKDFSMLTFLFSSKKCHSLE